MNLPREELVDRLIKAGEAEVMGAPPEEGASYFDTERFHFYGPDGFEMGYEGLDVYFDSIRAAFEDRSIRRSLIVVEDNRMACQTWIEGQFAHEFTQSPAGPLPPTGERVTMGLQNLFVLDDEGRLIEETCPDRLPEPPQATRRRGTVRARPEPGRAGSGRSVRAYRNRDVPVGTSVEEHHFLRRCFVKREK